MICQQCKKEFNNPQPFNQELVFCAPCCSEECAEKRLSEYLNMGMGIGKVWEIVSK